MNIFATDKDPVKSAAYLDDKRVVKMCLETAQLLCGAINVVAGEQVTPYKTSHKNHPCSIWTRQTLSNWMWLYRHGKALAAEYTARYGKTHKCEAIMDEVFDLAVEYIPVDVLTE